MKKRKMIFLAGTAIGAVACSDADGDSRPLNIIYILADDLGYGDLGCTGQTRYSTPNIDRMASEGMLFTQHYAGCTVSAPSRSALMTGMHTGHTPIRGNKEMPVEGQMALPDSVYTVAEMLADAGYRTGAFGKWGLGAPSSEGDPMNQGFDRFYGYNCQRQAHRHYPFYLWSDDERVIFQGNSTGVPTEFAPDYIHAQALSFIEENKDEPFFAYLAYTLPHAELLVPEDSLYLQFAGSFEERPYRPQGADYGLDMNVAAYSPQEAPHATFAAMVSRLDVYVGQVMAKVRELGIEDRTVVMFTSDNGPHCEGGADPAFFNSAGPFRGVKRDLTEGGIRLPLIVWAPGRVEEGKINEHICASWDMMSTFADMAGIKVANDVKTDGLSIYPTLLGNETGQEKHDWLFWEFHEGGGDMAVRKGQWKAIKKNIRSGMPRMYLFKLSSDVHEDNNLADSYPEIVAEMDSIMQVAHRHSDSFPL